MQPEQKLVNRFIRLAKAYHLQPTLQIFRELKQINDDYQVINGGGCLFKTIGISLFRKQYASSK